MWPHWSLLTLLSRSFYGSISAVALKATRSQQYAEEKQYKADQPVNLKLKHDTCKEEAFVLSNGKGSQQKEETSPRWLHQLFFLG